MAFLPLIPALTAAAGAMSAASAATAAVGGVTGALSLGATALGVAGTGMQAVAAERAATYNARVNEMQAQQAQEQGALKASEIVRRSRQTDAAGRAAALQNGFALTGSVADVLDQSQRQGQLDALTAIYDGSVSAASSRSSAALSRSQAKNAITAGVIGMGTQALGGASSYYRQRTAQIGV